jgi:FAD:protein FMN transferase
MPATQPPGPAARAPARSLCLAVAAMGTRFELVLAGFGARIGGDPFDLRRWRAAGELALAEIEECDRLLSRFRRDSLLSRVNRRAAVEPVLLDQDTFELLEVCARVHRESAGAFDVTVGPRMSSLGFHPPPAELGAADLADFADFAEFDGAPVGFQHVELDPEARSIRFRRPGLSLDLGAIGKGHALELAAQRLIECGVASALLHGGASSVIAIGTRPDGKPWRVALGSSSAVGTGGGAPPSVDLADRALSVSAQQGRRLADGRGHVLDPRTGESVADEAFVAVVHPSARIAEAWSTAILVSRRLAPDAWRACCAGGGTAILGVPAQDGRRAWTVHGAERQLFRSAAGGALPRKDR